MSRTKSFDVALEDAELLMTYASRNGIDVDPEVVTVLTRILTAKLSEADQSLTAEEQAAFYSNYRILAKSVLPVTSGSIRDSEDAFATPTKRFALFGKPVCRAPASWAVIFFSVQTFIALGALLYLQVVWAFGNTLLERIRQNTESIIKISQQADATAAPAIANLENTIAEVQSLYRLLLKWRDSVPLPKEKIELPTVNPTEPWQSKAVAGQVKASAENLVSILQVYFLPLLYGWLGACTYVLRQLVQEVRSRTYRKAMDRAFLVRVVLGIIAGLSIGWFLRPEITSSGTAQVGPLALAFLAGYSVEVLFSAMDRFISAFGSVSQTAKS